MTAPREHALRTASNSEKFGGLFGLLILLLGFITLHALAPQPFGERRKGDLLIIRNALELYRSDHGAYPVNGDFSPAWDGGVHHRDWISGLSPHYLVLLPEDPRGTTDQRFQYLYKSDGKDYKLICHAPEDFQIVARVHPDWIDPRRPSWAYGVWTSGAAQW